MERNGIACVGNWILDVVHTIPAWPERSGLALISEQHTGLGGGPANVAAGLTAMGATYPLVPVGLVGTGALGDEVLRLCNAAGLPTAAIHRTAEAATAQTHVMNVPGDSRTFFHYPGASARLDAELVDIAALDTRLFYLGYLTLLPALDRFTPAGDTGAARLLSAARRAGMTTCVDLASSETPGFRQIVDATLPAIDYLFANEREAGLATGRPLTETATEAELLAAARQLKDGGVTQAVILHSPSTVVWSGPEEEMILFPDPIPEREYVSAVGAGDAFAAGVLHGVHEGFRPGDSLALGMRAAAACLTGYTATDGLGGVSLDP